MRPCASDSNDVDNFFQLRSPAFVGLCRRSPSMERMSCRGDRSPASAEVWLSCAELDYEHTRLLTAAISSQKLVGVIVSVRLTCKSVSTCSIICFRCASVALSFVVEGNNNGKLCIIIV